MLPQKTDSVQRNGEFRSSLNIMPPAQYVQIKYPVVSLCKSYLKQLLTKKKKEDVRVPACGYSRWMNKAASAIKIDKRQIARTCG